jgi:hypothetical protein
MFECDLAVGQSAFPLTRPRHVSKASVERQATVNRALENPFPIRRIRGLRKENNAVSVECELPDVIEAVWLPLALVEILHPEGVIDFLTDLDESDRAVQARDRA